MPIKTPFKISRDTGASHFRISSGIFSFVPEKISSDTSVLIQRAECGFVNVPIYNIYLSSDLVIGLVAEGI